MTARMTASQYPGKAAKRHKYRAIRAYRCEACGAAVEHREQACKACGKLAVISFDSRLEARRWDELRQMQSLGFISDLKRQVPFPITVNGQEVATYRADFQYVEKGALKVEDCKGIDTPVSTLKRKLVEAIHGVTVEVVRAA